MKPIVVVKLNDEVEAFIPNYNVTPNNPLRFKLSGSANTIYNYLCKTVGSNLFAWPKINKIAKDVYLDPTTVIRTLNKLEEEELIIRIRQGQGKSNLYLLIWHDEFKQELRSNCVITRCVASDLDPNMLRCNIAKCHFKKSQNATSRSRKLPPIYNNKSIDKDTTYLTSPLNTSYLKSDEDNASQEMQIPIAVNSSETKPDIKLIHSKPTNYGKAVNTGRLIPVKEVKKKKYSNKVLDLYEYWNTLGVGVKHKTGSKSEQLTLKEIHNKLRQEGIEAKHILDVMEKYALWKQHPDNSKKAKLPLSALLNNGNYFNWWKFFTENTTEQTVTKRKRTLRKVDQSKYDDNAETTKRVARLYTKEILGQKFDEENFGYDSRYIKFKDASKRVKDIVEKNKGSTIFKNETTTIRLVFAAVIDAFGGGDGDMRGVTINPGNLGNDHTWKVLLPQYLKKLNMDFGVRW